MLHVLGRASSINVRKVLWLIDELGIEREHEERWATPEQPTGNDPAFLRLNPNGLVPVIREGDFVLWESNTICRYLAAAHGRSDLLPAEPRPRAAVEQWMDWQAGDLNSAWRYAFMALVRRHPEYRDEQAVRRSAEGWNRHMRILEARLAATDAFAAGASFTLADIVLGLSLHRWRMTPFEKPALPAIEAYRQRLEARPAYRRWATSSWP